MRVISLSNASSLEYGGETYEPGPDGVFNLPEPVGRELTTKHASMWVTEMVHLAAISAAVLDKLRDPNQMVTVVADLIGRVTALEAKLAPAGEPESEAPPAETGGQAGAEEPKKQTAAQKRAAAKKTAASKAPAKGGSTPDTAAPAKAEKAEKADGGEQPVKADEDAKQGGDATS